MTWLDVGGGELSVGHRPKLRRLRELGATEVLTLLLEREGARGLGRAIEGAGIGWRWFPFEPSDPPTAVVADRALRPVLGALAGGARVFVHCSAGIHRTGAVAYALLRATGDDRTGAVERLARLRPLCADELTDARRAWAETVAASLGAPR